MEFLIASCNQWSPIDLVLMHDGCDKTSSISTFIHLLMMTSRDYEDNALQTLDFVVSNFVCSILKITFKITDTCRPNYKS